MNSSLNILDSEILSDFDRKSKGKQGTCNTARLVPPAFTSLPSYCCSAASHTHTMCVGFKITKGARILHHGALCPVIRTRLTELTGKGGWQRSPGPHSPATYSWSPSDSARGEISGAGRLLHLSKMLWSDYVPFEPWNLLIRWAVLKLLYQPCSQAAAYALSDGYNLLHVRSCIPSDVDNLYWDRDVRLC